MTEHDWRLRARCRGTDPNRFFPPDGMRDTERARFIAAAQTICAQCPVRGECLTEARNTGQHYGVWGGVDMVYDNQPAGTRGWCNQPYAQPCAGGCGRTVATPGMMQPGYLPVSSHGKCSSCSSREYRQRRGPRPTVSDVAAAHEEVLRQRRQGIPVERIAINTGYSPRNVTRILNRQRETAQ